MQRIPLCSHSGQIRAYALVDDEDYEFVTQWRWCLDSVGYAKRGQTLAGNQRRTIRLHRQILGLEIGDPRHTDHLNGDRLDCRRANLRIVTAAQNAQNIHVSRGSSQYRGVSWHKAARKWRAYGRVNGRMKHLGLFASEAEAADVASKSRALHLPYSVS